MTLEVVGSDDSMVLLLLVLIVDELMLVSELESLPVDADEEPLDIRDAVELDRMSVDEDIKLALESDAIDWVDVDVVEGWEASELDVDTVELVLSSELNMPEELAEDGLELSEDIEDGLEKMLKELVTIEDWLSAELVDGSNVLEEVDSILVLRIEVLESTELDEPLSELEVALIDTGAD